MFGLGRLRFRAAGAAAAIPMATAAPVPAAGRLLTWLLALFLAVAAVGMLAGSFVSITWLNEVASRYSGRGARDLISPEFFASMVDRLRLAGLLYAGIAAGVVAFRRPIARAVAGIGPSTREGARDLGIAMRGMVRSDPLVVWSLLAVVAVAVLLRAVYLGQPMRYDESWTVVSFVEMPAYMIPLRYNVPNNHILNTLLIKLAAVLFGSSEVAVRLPAFLFGVGLVPAVFLLLRTEVGALAGLLAAALVAVSSPLIEFSTNARGYSAVSLAFVVMLLAGRYALRTRSPAAWALFALAGTLGAYAVPIMALPAAIAVLWLAALALMMPDATDRRRALGGLAAGTLAMGALTVMLYGPVLALNGPHALTSNEGVQAGRGLAWVLPRLGPFAADLFQTWTRDIPPVLAWPALALAVLAPLLALRGRASLLALAGATLLIVGLYLAVVADLGFPRVWLFVLVVWLLMSTAGLAGLVERLAGRGNARASLVLPLALLVAGSGAVLAGGTVRTSTETGLFREADAVTRFLMAEMGPEDLVLVDAWVSAAPMTYYARRQGTAWIPLETRDGVRSFRRANAGPGRAPGERAIWFVVNGEDGTRRLPDLMGSLSASGLPQPLDPQRVLVRPGAEVYRAAAPP